MAITIKILDAGVEYSYFRIKDRDGTLYVEQPDKAAIKMEAGQNTYETVINALKLMSREEEKWKALQEGTAVAPSIFEEPNT